MVFGLIEFVLVALVLALFVVAGWAIWGALRRASAGPAVLPARQRAELAAAIAHARWAPGHDEVDGVTRVLVRRAYTGLDGQPVVLEERVLETFPAGTRRGRRSSPRRCRSARFRCAYLNAEESQ